MYAQSLDLPTLRNLDYFHIARSVLIYAAQLRSAELRPEIRPL